MTAVWTALIVAVAWLADRTTERVTAYKTAKRRDAARAAKAKASAS